jgi:(Z)-2-((N-methylformamido)methylene)-5-hydroxybutyrolactone dehydrogenase
MKTCGHYIDGGYVDPIKGNTIDSFNPYTGEVWARISQGCAGDVDRAVGAASRVMREGPWATMTPTERGKLMLRLADLVAANAERLAEIEVHDNGKLLAEMLGQLKYHPEWWRYFGGLADKIEGAVVPIDKPDMFAFTRHEPVGVVAALTAYGRKVSEHRIRGLRHRRGYFRRDRRNFRGNRPDLHRRLPRAGAEFDPRHVQPAAC